jgi:hypothetical protein
MQGVERGESCCRRLRQGNTNMTSTAMSSGGGPSFRQRGHGHIRASTTAAITVLRGQTQQRRTTATAGNLPFPAMIRVDTRDGRRGLQRHPLLVLII